MTSGQLNAVRNQGKKEVQKDIAGLHRQKRNVAVVTAGVLSQPNVLNERRGLIVL